MRALPWRSALKKVVRSEVVQLESGRQRIVAVHVPAPGAGGAGGRAAPWTLLHSHGNAVDLGGWAALSGGSCRRPFGPPSDHASPAAGQMLPLYEELSSLLRCGIFAYDYQG